MKKIFSLYWIFLQLTFTEGSIRKDFELFVKKYDKNYLDNTDEYKYRYYTFKRNVEVAMKLNKERSHNDTAWYGVTKFSDLTAEEFKSQYLSTYNSTGRHSGPLLFMPQNGKLILGDYPLKKDWRDENIVTAVRNQKQCGGCWAFSTLETVESMYAKATNKLKKLSVQEVIDCSFGFGELLYGCKGGDTCGALSWMTSSGYPLVPSSQYPLTDKMQKCAINPNTTTHGVKVKSYTCQNLKGYETSYMIKYLANHGPLAVSVDATTWSNYQGGIIQYHCGGNPNNHAVTIIGYDMTGEIPYYIIKNSWGTDFGVNGYLFLEIGKNLCGIAEEVSKVDIQT